jgi:hypothetical protein
MWFGDNIVRKIWDGEKTLFWEDIWVNGSWLKYMFGRLFDLCLDKDIPVTGMCWLGWGFGVNGWRWRRRLFAWEKDLWGDCWVVDASVVLKVDTSNNLEWLPDLATGYSVYRTYPILKILTPSELSAHCDLIWNKIVSLKVYVFAWQFVSDRLSTKSNLFPRGCLHNDSLLCLVGCDVMEDIHCLFLNCQISCMVWSDIIFWLGITCVFSEYTISLASQFCGAHDFCKNTRICLQAIWLTSIWYI